MTTEAIPLFGLSKAPWGVMTGEHVLRAVRHRKWMVLSIVVGLMTADLCVLVMLPQEYQAETLLEVDRRTAAPVDGEVRELPTDLDAGAVSSELNVINAPTIVLKVVQSERLLDTPEYREGLHLGPQTSSWIKRWLWSHLPERAVMLLDPKVDADISGIDRIREQDTIAFFLRRLSVSYDQHGGSLRIRYRSNDPVIAARVANAVAAAYVDEQISSKLELLRNAGAWLDDRVTRMRKKWEDSETDLEKFREQHNLGTDQAPVFAQHELATLNAKLVEARSHELETSSRLSFVESAAASHNLDSVTDVLQSETIQKLRQQESELASIVMAADDPHSMESVLTVNRDRAELAAVHHEISMEMQRILFSLRMEATVAHTRRTALQTEVAALTAQAEGRDQDAIRAIILEREVAANRLVVEAVINKMEEARTLDGLQRPDVRVISEARAPGRPFSPKPKLVLSLGAISALAVAIASALLLEHLRTPVRSIAEGERLFGLQGAGWLPEVTSRGGIQMHDLVGSKLGMVLGECLYSIAQFVRVNLSGAKHIVLVTSALPGEGKTSFALYYAQLLTASGCSCLVIDMDIRQPRVAKRLGGSKPVGVMDAISRSLPLDDVIQVDPKSKIAFIGGESGTAGSLNLLDTGEFAALIDAARRKYDTVIIDTPPLMATADPIWMAKHADLSLVVVKCSSTPARFTKDAIDRLRLGGTMNTAFVLSGVDTTKLGRYDLENYAISYAKAV